MITDHSISHIVKIVGYFLITENQVKIKIKYGARHKLNTSNIQ